MGWLVGGAHWVGWSWRPCWRMGCWGRWVVMAICPVKKTDLGKCSLLIPVCLPALFDVPCGEHESGSRTLAIIDDKSRALLLTNFLQPQLQPPSIHQATSTSSTIPAPLPPILPPKWASSPPPLPPPTQPPPPPPTAPSKPQTANPAPTAGKPATPSSPASNEQG